MGKFLKLLGLTAAAAGTASVVNSIKNKKVDVNTTSKRLKNSVALSLPVDEPYNNGVALTPPMGWSSWNTFRQKIDENLIYEIGLAMKNSGLLDAGYQYLNIDDCWQSSMRTEDGKLQGDLINFPSGIKNLADKVNALGLKLGLYTSNGTFTCEDLPASLGHEAIDAKSFAEWGIEYFKYDFCHNVPVPMRAPYIERITISKDGQEGETEYSIEEAILTGDARIVTDPKVPSGKYIAGISANSGTIEFMSVEAEDDGEYILTLIIRKKSNSNKFCIINVNNEHEYTTIVPPTRAWSPMGRHQVKIDLKAGINSICIYNPIASRQDSSCYQYTLMGQELKKATQEYAADNNVPNKPIVYSICEWGFNLPWHWGGHAGNLWRTTPDIKAYWAVILAIYEVNVKLAKYAGIGAWNDPDMLEVGNGNLTYNENIAHFSLWCMMAAPLILGNDIRTFLTEDGNADLNNEILKIVTDKDLIAINQDKLGVQCRRIKTNGLTDILVKPLENDEVAICFFNKSNDIRQMEASFVSISCKPFISLPIVDSYEVFDLWEKEKEVLSDKISTYVNPHGVKVFRVKAI